MTNLEKITQLRTNIAAIKVDIFNARPDRLSQEDIEDVSDNYQANLEFGWYKDEQQALIDDITEEIAGLEKLPAGGQYDETPWSYEEARDEIYS